MQSMDDRSRYARCVEISRRIRWDTDRDVLRGRRLDFSRKFLPDGLSRVRRLDFLDPGEHRLLSQVQGRTYSNLIRLAERFISAKVLELSRDYWLGDQVALEALVRFGDEELKHQALFRRIDALAAEGLPPGYAFQADPNDFARIVLGKSTWAVLALTLHVELSTQAHYRLSIEPDPDLAELFRDVFLYHWREESQHVVLDELEWRREDARLTPAQRDAAVDEFLALVGALDAVLQIQSDADADYFARSAGRHFSVGERVALRSGLLAAYRWQHVVSGMRDTRFQEVLGSLVTPAQAERIGTGLAPLFLDVRRG